MWPLCCWRLVSSWSLQTKALLPVVGSLVVNVSFVGQLKVCPSVLMA